MLNPSSMVDAIVTTLQKIPDLAAAMTVLDSTGAANCRISGFHYRLGVEHRLAEMIYKMAPCHNRRDDTTGHLLKNGARSYRRSNVCRVRHQAGHGHAWIGSRQSG
jgi:hypothetical protein